ncbi:MAG: serine hydrolase [Acidobacteria bacterium]|nr:serine hydrolase [Acidobacteriota bacterium]MCA1639391.1 serine hydrolase [Acidobacteriota bacterium]
MFRGNFLLLAVGCLLLIVMFSVFAPAQTVANVDSMVQKWIDAKMIPGASVAVVRDGKIILAKGYGVADVETGTMANEHTAYQVASLTKQFTAAGIMLLVEDGMVKLDDPLGKYLPDLPEHWNSVTVRQLLNQVSGIQNYAASRKIVPDKNYTQAEILGFVRDIKPLFEPGAKWHYSNTNYFLLGMIIEKVSGKSYPDFMRERIFKPLGMNSTTVNTSGLKIKNAALGYKLENANWQKTTLGDPSQPFAAGAIVSTAADMAKWALALSKGKLLKKSSWDEIWTLAKLSDGKATIYGFGWEISKIYGTNYIGHGGKISGFSSYIARFPYDNLSIVVLVNNAEVRKELIAFDIAGLYLPKVEAALGAENAARNAVPIEDTDPATTKFLRETFEKIIAGDVDQNVFSPEMQTELFPDNIKQLKLILGSQRAIKAFDLIKAETTQSVKSRHYRATFEKMKVRLNFTINAEGKISRAIINPE